jgi:hypothetical protein
MLTAFAARRASHQLACASGRAAAGAAGVTVVRAAPYDGRMDEYGCGIAMDCRRYAHRESQYRINQRIMTASSVGQVRAEALRRRPPIRRNHPTRDVAEPLLS